MMIVVEPRRVVHTEGMIAKPRCSDNPLCITLHTSVGGKHDVPRIYD